MPTNTQKLTPAGQSPVLALALGSAAWLRAQADEREEMLHALGALDDEGERETKREILGLRDAADRLEKLERAPVVTDDMVSRFLCWRLPATFSPDGGVSFDKKDRDPNSHWWPVGTNILNAEEARQMIEHILGLPNKPDQQ